MLTTSIINQGQSDMNLGNTIDVLILTRKKLINHNRFFFSYSIVIGKFLMA